MNKNDKVVNIENIPLIKNIQENISEEIVGNVSDINKALNDCRERNIMYTMYNRLREKELKEKYNIEPNQCYNSPCECCNGDHECLRGEAIGCIFRMIDHPPNSLDYDEYMPSHKEALDMLEKHNLLKGERQEYLEANSTYNKPITYEERDNTEVKGITMAQARDAILHAIIYYMDLIKEEDFKTQEEKDEFDSHYDPDVIARNACIELEKAMGIYPNIRI